MLMPNTEQVGFGVIILILLTMGWLEFGLEPKDFSKESEMRAKMQKRREKLIPTIRKLEQGGELFRQWVDNPFPVYMKLYFFNVTNPEKVKQGEKPILKEIGPYVYEEKRHRNVVYITTEKNIEYRDINTYYFRADLSNGRKESDVITNIDIFYLVLVYKFMAEEEPNWELLQDLTEKHGREPFMQRTVKELAFGGYIDRLAKELGELEGEDLVKDNKLGFFIEDNGTSHWDHLRQVNSGMVNNHLLGEKIAWNQTYKVKAWGSNHCNTIKGSDGTIFPPNVTRNRILHIFKPDYCRSFPLKYEKDVKSHGVDGYKFVISREVLASPKVNPENLCYCDEPGEGMEDCAETGVLDLSTCVDWEGTPYYLSWPHFYNGDEFYITKTVGLTPDKGKHETFFVVEPNTGAVIKARQRMQLNFVLAPAEDFPPMSSVPHVLMPILWMDESLEMEEESKLEPDGTLYSQWVDSTLETYTKLYFFNVTNPNEVKQGEKPVLDEIGPYVFKEKRERVVEKIDVESIWYRAKSTYYFRQDLSFGRSLNDVITLVDIIYVGLADKAIAAGGTVRFVIGDITREHGKDLFMQRTVNELTFGGYLDPVIEELGEVLGAKLLPNDTFGFYYGKNGTTGDLMQINSGIVDTKMLGKTISWKEEDKMTFWESEYCNMINGSDGTIFPPNVKRNSLLQIFRPDLCRSIIIEYSEDEQVLGVPGYKFVIPSDVLESPKVNRDNLCYCTRPGDDMEGCAKAGVIDMSLCRNGFPVAFSWPHFYDGDKFYFDQSVGLNPTKEKHESFITVEPETGSVIKASIRKQLNLQLKTTKKFRPLKSVPNMLMPIFWSEETLELNEDRANILKEKLRKV